jgi:hypothetical protein
MKNAALWAALSYRVSVRARLFNLSFLERHVLARHRIVFAKFKFLGLRARVLLGDVIIAGIGCAQQFDNNSA